MGIIFRLYPIALVFILWEVVARAGLVSPLFLPTFSGAVTQFYYHGGMLLMDAVSTLWRAFAGLAIGGTVGLLVGMMMANFRAVDQFFDPLIGALFPTPKLALFPLLMVWLGLGDASKIALVALSAFFPVAINTYSGMKSVDKFLVWNARTKGASAYQVLLKVMLPAALPFIFTGLRVATSFSFLLVVAAEMLGASGGLGFRILFAQRTMESEQMYAAILFVAALGFLVDRLVGLIGHRLLAWQDTAN